MRVFLPAVGVSPSFATRLHTCVFLFVKSCRVNTTLRSDLCYVSGRRVHRVQVSFRLPAVQSSCSSPYRKVFSVSSRRSAAGVPNLNGWEDAAPRHGTAYRVQHRVRNVIVCVVAALLTFAGTASASTLLDIQHTINSRSTDVIGQDGKTADVSVVDPNAGKPINVLVLGQDTREGAGNAAVGGEGADLAANHQADTTMVVQIAADRSYVNLVSIPRDSIVDVPSCTTTNGTIGAQYDVMFNSIFATAYQRAGNLSSAASCTMNAVNSLTGLDIQNFIVVDFNGLKTMIDAVDGVDLCIPSDVNDPNTGVDLAKGWHHLDGMAATQYARLRHGAGDGSDIQRTTRQQYLVKQLLQQALNKNMLTQSGQLYQLAKAALKSLNISKGLANTTTLAGLAMSMKSLDTSHLYARTVPVTSWARDRNRVVWTADADTLWAKMRNDTPFVEQQASSGDSGSSSDANDSSDANGSDQQSDTSSQTSGSQDSTDNSGQQSESSKQISSTITEDASGNYIDASTGGVIDKDTGIIKDATTGLVIGISEDYLNNVACKAS
ncbi:LCP family protein [Bifidobacterium sp. CP2]|nr:LCP family protein [Bifidobacterium sp. CP2]